MNDPGRQRELLQAIESCRPGSDDLALPELAAAELLANDPQARQFRQRMQQADVLIAQAFHQVDLPQGLLERLLAALPAPPGCDEPGQVVPPVALRPGTVGPSRARRYWVAAALTLGLVAAIAGGLWLASGSPVGMDQALASAIAAQGQLAQMPDGPWNAMADAPPTHPFPAAQIRGVPTGFKRVSGLGDRAGAAYRLGRGATLFVFRPRGTIEGLPAGPPASPRNPSGSGVNFGVWAVQGVVYVLRVEGSPDDYRRALVRSSSPLASLAPPQILPDRHDA